MTEAMLLTPRPAHVPETLLFDFDISNDPLLRTYLHRGLIDLSHRTPEIFWTPRYGGHWVVRAHGAIFGSLLRFVTHDTEFRGVRLGKGERMHILLPAGNLDPQVYANPEQIELGRDEPITTFGVGVHRCLGSHLARLELRTLFEEMLSDWPEFGLDPADLSVESAGIVYSVDRLPLVWTPVSASRNR